MFRIAWALALLFPATSFAVELRLRAGSGGTADLHTPAVDLALERTLADRPAIRFSAAGGFRARSTPHRVGDSARESVFTGATYAGAVVELGPERAAYARSGVALEATREWRDERGRSARTSWGAGPRIDARGGVQFPIGDTRIFFELGGELGGESFTRTFLTGIVAPLHRRDIDPELPMMEVTLQRGFHRFDGVGWHTEGLKPDGFGGDATQVGFGVPIATASVARLEAAVSFGTYDGVGSAGSSRIELVVNYADAGARVVLVLGNVVFHAQHGVGVHYSSARMTGNFDGVASSSRMDPSQHVAVGAGLQWGRFRLFYEHKDTVAEGAYSLASRELDVGGSLDLFGIALVFGREPDEVMP